MSNLSYKKDEGSFEVFDHTLSHEIYSKRKEDRQNPDFLKKAFENLRRILFFLPEDAFMETPSNIHLPTHEFVGIKLKEKETGRVYVSEKVCLQFYGGWFFGVLLNCEGSHTFLYFHNHSCMNETILEGIQEFWERFEKL